MVNTKFLLNTAHNFNSIELSWTIKNYRFLKEIDSHMGLKTDDILIDGIQQNFYLKLGSPNGYLTVSLNTVDNGNFKTNGYFVIYKLNDSPVSKNSIFQKSMNVVKIHLTEWNKLFVKQNGFLPEDDLILDCQIVWVANEVNNCKQVNSLKVPDCNLTEDLGALLETKEFADVTIVTADDRKIPAHKNILSARSKVFAAMFRHPMKENTENCVDIGDFSFDVVMELLRFIYTGEAPNLKEITVDLIAAADKYELDRLKAMCARSLIDTISIETAPMVLKTADLYNIEDLKSEAIEFIKAKVNKISKTEKWMELVKTDRHLVLECFISDKMLLGLELGDESNTEDEESSFEDTDE